MGRSKRYKKHGKRRTLKRVRHVGGNQIYISGEAFKNLCKYNLDDRYKIKGIDSTLEENDSVFLKQGDIKSFIKSKPSKKVRLIVHNTDETFDDNLMNTVKPYVSKVYAVNSSAKDAIQLPLGFRDDQYTPHNVLDKVKGLGESVRDILCLLNFSIGKGNNERSDARDSFIGKKWCVIDTNDNPGLHLDHKNNETVRLREEFYTKLTKTKFVICPFGAGKDTHRVYEALFFGAIPVIKTSFLDEMYKKLGECWIVNDWSEVTEDECNRRWNAGGFKPFKSNVSEWLSMSGGSSRPVKIAFYSNHLGERGTEVAMYDYAMFNESLLNNKYVGGNQVNTFHFYNDCHYGDNILNLKFLYNISKILKEKNIKIKYYYMNAYIKNIDELERYIDKEVLTLHPSSEKPHNAIQLWMGEPVNSIGNGEFQNFYNKFYKKILTHLGLNDMKIDTSLFQKEDYLLDIYNKLDPKFKDIDILIINGLPQSGQFDMDKTKMDAFIKDLASKYKVVTTDEVSSNIVSTRIDKLKMQDIGAISTHAKYIIGVFTGPFTSLFNIHTKNYVKKWYILNNAPFQFDINYEYIHNMNELDKIIIPDRI
jgi:hypothetical protein